MSGAILDRRPIESESDSVARRILVRGAVQGVGFRPFVYRHAIALGLAGWVENSTQGVAIQVEGAPHRIDSLVGLISSTPPPNAVIAAIEIDAAANTGSTAFAIRLSDATGEGAAQILPDIATCPDCLAEMFDPFDRRYLYPFINCTHCGPRYSIVESIPYDRERTAMRHFPMCPACRSEYDDPSDRRFHAEATACPACGPSLTLGDWTGRTLASANAALLAAATALRDGRIVAVKGIGGFHLMCDARNEATVRELRARKHRPDKPFAVMFPSPAEIKTSCETSAAEETLLTGPARPIVLLRRSGNTLAPSVAPGNPWLGAMLPYAPVHHLLLHELGTPMVATSGNISDEPIVIDATEAATRLAGIADLFLAHDRPILRPVDDSVARVVCGRPLLLRRSRGYAPSTVPFAGVAPGILALGGHLKTTIGLTQADGVTLSQHIGDLEAVEARAAHRQAIADLSELYPTAITRVIHDLHPDYASTRAAARIGIAATPIQHHLAHVVACMADNGLAPPVLGVAWDGTGYGADGTIWGGEFLTVTENGWRRAAHLRAFPLPGGEAAAREPKRAAVGLLWEAYGEAALDMTDLAPVGAFTTQERGILHGMMTRGVNSPRTSSAGRLFDAFAALCGLRQRASYEGQAAAEFEWSADGAPSREAYLFTLRDAADDQGLIVDWRPALDAALVDLRAGASPGAVSAALHLGLAEAIVAVAKAIGIPRLALSGGCFQNARLTEVAVAALRISGFEPFWHRLVPPNDGGIALGQAVWAAWTASHGDSPCV